MKPRSISELTARLRAITEANIAAAEEMSKLDAATLNRRSAAKAWSALEAIEHARLFGDIYLPAFQRHADRPCVRAQINFTSSWLGNKMAGGMKPGPKTRKIKALSKMNPLGSDLDTEVLSDFIRQQRETLAVIDRSEEIDWQGKVPTSLPLLKLRFGDALRLFVYHNWRHVEQAQRAAGTFVAKGG